MTASRAASVRGDGLARIKPPFGQRHMLARAIAGDKRAFAKIFERHHQELYRYCLAIVRNPADAEDALQSTMSKALTALPGEGRQISLRPWLFRVAHNESISIVRRRRPESADGLEELSEESAEITSERREHLRTLVADLQALPERQRSALVMRELSDLGYEEIATALDCSEGSARQTVYEARQALLTREEGRQMDCAEARRALSDGDRRRLRNRRLRAHLASCDGCSDFQTAIADRRADLRAIAPPIPAAAAAAALSGALGGGSAGVGAGAVGTGAGAVAAGAAGGLAVKGASVAAAVVLAAGVADATGVVDLPTPLGDRDKSPTEQAPPAAGGKDEQSRGGGADSSGGSSGNPAGSNGSKAGGNGNGGGNGRGKSENAPGKSGGGGKSDSAPGQSGTSPGQSGSTPGQSGSSPGQSGSTPGQSGTTPSDGGAAPGQTGTSPGQGATTPGQTSSTPGQAGTTPTPAGEAGGDSATAPGQSKEP
jgi:RNA polymerase sigma factor (sigma-70 family)